MQVKIEQLPLKANAKTKVNSKKDLAVKIMETLMELKVDFKELKSIR